MADEFNDEDNENLNEEFYDENEDDGYIEEEVVPRERTEKQVLVATRYQCGRKALKPMNSTRDSVAMQWVDIDMYSGQPMKKNPHAGRKVQGASDGPVSIIRLFGVTEQGNSVLFHVRGVTPYFYCNVPSGFHESPQSISAFRMSLNTALEARKRGGEVCPNYILGVEVVHKQSLLGYHGGTLQPFFKIFVPLPNYVATAKGILQSGFSFGEYTSHNYQCYEANVPFVLRYMIDNKIVGGNWLEAAAGTYSIRPLSEHVSHCQLEIDIMYDSLISHEAEGEWMKMAPFRILSFDIECQGRKGFFPEAEKDPVIQIANIVTEYGKKDQPAVCKNIFVLDTCSAIVGADVYSFKDEASLLVSWAHFLKEVDADIITGYNVQNFDIPYLLNRSKALKCDDTFSKWGRMIDVKSKMKETTFSSSARGKRENTDTSIIGRVTFDMIAYMRINHKLSSYSLNAVSTEFLGKQKEDVHHSIISDLQRGSEDDRRRLAVYCLKDACLPLELMEKLMVLVNHIEMARVTGVPLNFLLTRGQQIKVVSMIYRECIKHNFIVPTIERRGGGGDEVTFEGATVIEPKKGYYDTPIATLDFASLYPSIMQAHNLCYSTLVSASDVKKYPPESIEKTPTNDYFIKTEVQKGVLPTILDALLSARKKAKSDMKKATDPDIIAVQNGRQLALKISANSVYGFTGATIGQLPCLAISSSVTGYGRQMIDQTAAAVEKKYTIENGYPADAVVIYGDTDSVMVKFGVPGVEEAMKLGQEAANECTKLFPFPIKLEFEKVYFPYLLMAKKRYAGLYWTNPIKYDKLDAKGIETVRRDNCMLVRKVISTCLTKILMERNIPGAVQYVKDTISDLLQNKMDISMLVITKALSKTVDSNDYKAKTAHVELAERMRKRDPGSAPVIGDRVPYVIIESAKGTPAFKKSEDPVYVLENSIPIDTNYYLENQLSKPLLRIFGPVIPNPNSLLNGEHTRTIRKVAPTKQSGGIMAFAVKMKKCMNCKTGMDNSEEGGLCGNCKHLEGKIFIQTSQKVNKLEDAFNKLWTQCQRCQGSLHQDVLCTSRDCPIFYQRKKVQLDLDVMKEKMDNMDLAF